MGETGKNILVYGSLVVIGLAVFAWYPAADPAAWAALGVTGIAMLLVLRKDDSPLSLLGLARPGNYLSAWLPAGIITGIFLGMLNRILSPVPVLPVTLYLPALVAPLIGMTEELVFRGFIQGLFEKYSPYAAILLAAAGHTLYKSVLLIAAGQGEQTDLLLLVSLTFVVGCIFGWYRKKWGHIYAPLLAHGLFDLLVYGDQAEFPFWVWF